jgi:hypothetical protein
MTPKGQGLAHVLIDYGIESELMWTVFLVSNGECWTYANHLIRGCRNISINRTLDDNQEMN